MVVHTLIEVDLYTNQDRTFEYSKADKDQLQVLVVYIKLYNTLIFTYSIC